MEDSLGSRQRRDGSLGAAGGEVAGLLDLLGCLVGWWVDEEEQVVLTLWSSSSSSFQGKVEQGSKWWRRPDRNVTC